VHRRSIANRPAQQRAGSSRFGVTSVARPEQRVTERVADPRFAEPIAGARREHGIDDDRTPGNAASPSATARTAPAETSAPT